jgi:hypothetical protein
MITYTRVQKPRINFLPIFNKIYLYLVNTMLIPIPIAYLGYRTQVDFG